MEGLILAILKEYTEKQNEEFITHVKFKIEQGELAQFYGKSVSLTEWRDLYFLHVFDYGETDFKTYTYHKNRLQLNLEKYAPKNIQKQTYNLSQDTYSYYGHCGYCGSEVDINYNRYCGNCGKKVDWSDVDE